MFTSFDENAFNHALKDRDYLRLKINLISAIRNDPTFVRSETPKVLQILEEQVPEIFEEYVRLAYEERLERNAWDKRYFVKLTTWLQDNFSKSRIEHIKEVGKAVHKDTEKLYKASMAINSKSNNSQSFSSNEQADSSSRTKSNISQNNTAKYRQESEKRNFPIAGMLLAVGILVLIIVLLVK